MSKFRIDLIRRLRICSILFMIMISACNLFPGGITPEDAVQKTFESQDYEIALVQRLEKDAVVLYHKPQPEFIPGDPLHPTYPFGFSLVEQRDTWWWVREGLSGTFTPEPGANDIFLLHQIKAGEQDQKMHHSGDASLAIIFGKVLNQTIDMVEARGDDGTRSQVLSRNHCLSSSKPMERSHVIFNLWMIKET